METNGNGRLRPRARGTPPRGSILVIVLILLAGLAVISLGLSMVAMSSSRYTESTVDRQQALMLAEAGLNAALCELNASKDISGEGAIGYATEQWDRHQSYVAWMGAGSTPPSPPPASPPLNADGTYTIWGRGLIQNKAMPVTRTVVGVAGQTSGGSMPCGAFGKDYMRAVGTVDTDSYESAKGSYAATKSNSSGSVGSNGPVSANGNVKVNGDAKPGPGQLVNLVGGAVVSGSTAPYESPVPTPDPIIPAIPPTAVVLPTAAPGTINAGTYRIDSFTLQGNASKVLTFKGKVVLYVTGSLAIRGQASMLIDASPGSSLTIYQTGSGNIDLGGGGLVNATSNPNNFKLLSTSTGSISIGGNSAFYGVAYAPKAAVTLRGTSDFYGAVLGKTMDMNGTFGFHYDKSISMKEIPGRFILLAHWEK